MNKFEQLIEYVINDEEAKAKELFHEIVVEKSRQIYEEMMQEEEELEEAKKEEEEEELEEAKKEEEEVEESKLNEESDEEEEVEESLAQETMMGGDQADDLIDDVEAEEQGMSEGDGEEESGAEDLEDRVVDLEDKLDELMAEFEALMGDDAGAEEADVDMELDMDTPDMDAEEVVDDELETEGMKMPMEEAVNLKAAPAPVKSEEAGVNKKPVVAANSGAKGAVAKPVHVTGETAQGRSAPTAKDAIGKVGNTPAQSTQEPKPAVKPTLSQAAGVNTKSVIQ